MVANSEPLGRCRGQVTDAHYGAFVSEYAGGKGKSVHVIGSRYGVHRNTVARWLERGVPPSAYKASNPRKKSSAQAKAIKARRAKCVRLASKVTLVTAVVESPQRKIRSVKQYRTRPYRSAPLVARAIGNVSPSTIRRDLKACGLKAFVEAKGPPLTEDHRKRRRAFCRTVLATPQGELDKLMFADEKNFGLITNTCRTFYWASEPSTETTTAKVTSGAAFMVMGFISAT